MRFIGRSLLCTTLVMLPRYAAAQGPPVRLDPIVVREAAPPRELRPTQQLIQGKLVDETTGLPIARGIIELWADGDKPLATATTDTSGIFQLITPSPGVYALLGKQLGYQPARQPGLTLRLGDTLIVEFRLSHLAQLLDPVLVTATAKPWPPAKGERQSTEELYYRMKKFAGLRHAEFILRDTIDAYARKFYTIDDMIARVVTTPVPKPKPAGREFYCTGTTQYVDGMYMPTMTGFEDVTRTYNLEMIDLIEVYTHPSIPAEFKAATFTPGERSSGWPPCRVIVLWRRHKDSPLAAATRDTTKR